MVPLTIYLFLTCIIGYLTFIGHSKKIKKMYLKAVFLIAFLYMGLRGETVGVDTMNYNSIFNSILHQEIYEGVRTTEIEVGFVMLNLVLGRLIGHPQILHLVISAVVNGAFCSLIEKYSKDYVLSSVIYLSTVYMIAMNVSRQYLALAFLLFMTQAIFEKKPFKACVWWVIAITMHYSAIVMLPLILFATDKFSLTIKRGVLISAIMFVLVPLYNSVIDLFVSIFPKYSRFLGDNSKYSSGRELETSQLLFFALILILGILYIQPVKLKDNYKLVITTNHKPITLSALNEEESQYMYFFIMFIGYVVMYFISANLIIVHRFIYYFQGFMVVMVPNTIAMLKHRYKSKMITVVVSGVFVVYYLLFGVRYFQNDPHSIFPYMFFWE